MVPVHTVRQRVLAYLAKHPGVSATQIGDALGLSSPAARHHIAVLRSDGRVVLWSEGRGRARGRPVKLYRVSASLMGDNLSALADSLLEAWPGAPGSSKDALLIGVLAKGLVNRMGPLPPDIKGARKLSALIDRLNAAHYGARWEAGADGPRIVFENCPYSAIIEKHPELCKIDARLLERQMAVRASQISKISLKPSGPAHCIFVLR